MSELDSLRLLLDDPAHAANPLREALRRSVELLEARERQSTPSQPHVASPPAAPTAAPTAASTTGRQPRASMDAEQEAAWFEALPRREKPLDADELDWLAKRYRQLTRSLAKLARISDSYQGELRQTNNALAELNGDLEQFASRAAHDLKSPLTGVLGLASMLADESFALDAASVREFAREISWSGSKMVELIDALLMLARVRQEDVVRVPLDMGAVCAEALARLRAPLAEAKAELTQPSYWPKALGHAGWIEAVWVNYVSNAIKYGGRPPRITLGADAAQGGLVRFWVADNGPGLDEAQRKRLFHAFTRLHSGRGEGHGLGLTIVQRATQRLGGSTGVESTPNVGSRFWFTLPEASTSGPSSQEPAPPRKSP